MDDIKKKSSSQRVYFFLKKKEEGNLDVILNDLSLPFFFLVFFFFFKINNYDGLTKKETKLQRCFKNHSIMLYIFLNKIRIFYKYICNFLNNFM
jgi:hypothetical protein